MSAPARLANAGAVLDDATVERLVARLWVPGQDVYAILDGARDPRIHPWIRRNALDYTCLFAGALAPELAAAAPYLVHLYRTQRFTHELFRIGWGKSWGVLLRSDVPMETLRVHFRKLLRVKDERGRKLLFRYYDPRVLRVYLPTCTPRELTQFLGPVTAMIAEDGDAAERRGRALVFSWNGRALHTAALDLGSEAPLEERTTHPDYFHTAIPPGAPAPEEWTPD